MSWRRWCRCCSNYSDSSPSRSSRPVSKLCSARSTQRCSSSTSSLSDGSGSVSATLWLQPKRDSGSTRLTSTAKRWGCTSPRWGLWRSSLAHLLHWSTNATQVQTDTLIFLCLCCFLIEETKDKQEILLITCHLTPFLGVRSLWPSHEALKCSVQVKELHII